MRVTLNCKAYEGYCKLQGMNMRVTANCMEYEGYSKL